MDPTHLIAAPSHTSDRSARPSAQEIEGFYDAHGHEVFAVFSRWRRMIAAWRAFRNSDRAEARTVPTAAMSL